MKTISAKKRARISDAILWWAVIVVEFGFDFRGYEGTGALRYWARPEGESAVNGVEPRPIEELRAFVEHVCAYIREDAADSKYGMPRSVVDDIDRKVKAIERARRELVKTINALYSQVKP